MASSIAALVSVFLIFYSVAPSLATTYTVGDKQGWASGVDYTAWVKGKTFKVGDKLVFNFGTSHTLDEVSASDYNSCTLGNALSSEKSGPTTVTLKAGAHYYICGVPGHCDNGMKLSVNVGGAAAPSGSPAASDGPSTATNNNTTTPSSSNNTPESSSAVTLSSFVSVFSCLVALPALIGFS